MKISFRGSLAIFGIMAFAAGGASEVCGKTPVGVAKAEYLDLMEAAGIVSYVGKVNMDRDAPD